MGQKVSQSKTIRTEKFLIILDIKPDLINIELSQPICRDG